MKPVFADSFFFLATLNSDDQYYERASAFARTNRRQLVTTAWVLTEVGDALASIGNREVFSEFIRHLSGNPTVKIIPAEQSLFEAAIELYAQRPDKEWSVTDCISFLVMKEQDLSDAITGDHHFEQAGFIALLK